MPKEHMEAAVSCSSMITGGLCGECLPEGKLEELKAL